MLVINVGIGIELFTVPVCHGEVVVVFPMVQVSNHTNAITLHKLDSCCFIYS